MTLRIQFKSSLVRMWLCRVGIAQGEIWLDFHYTSHCQARQCACRLNGIGVRLGLYRFWFGGDRWSRLIWVAFCEVGCRCTANGGGLWQ